MQMRLLTLIQYLIGLLIFAETVYGEEDCHCPTLVYLRFMRKGKIACHCDHFLLVSWYSSKQSHDAGDVPFIKYDNLETRGPGKASGEFNLEPDGSLIINNVTMIYHEKKYFVVFLRDTKTVENTVKVEVIVPPDPLYPVLNGHMNHQYLYLDLKREGTLYCLMLGVHPKVNLSIAVIDQGQQDGIYFKQDDVTYSPNEDNTYDVNVTYNYSADLSVKISSVQCEVTGELSQLFSAVTTAEINFPPAHSLPAPTVLTPVIDGCNSRHGICMLKLQSKGELTCRVEKNIHQSVELQWNIFDGHQWQVSPGKTEVARDVSMYYYEAKNPQVILIAECFTVVGDKISAASAKVILVKEGDGESDNKSGYGALVGLNLFTCFLAIIILLIGISLSYFLRKMNQNLESLMLWQSTTPPRGGRPHSTYSDKEGHQQEETLYSPDSGNPDSTPRMRGRIAPENVCLVERFDMSNRCIDQTELGITEANPEEA